MSRLHDMGSSFLEVGFTFKEGTRAFRVVEAYGGDEFSPCLAVEVSPWSGRTEDELVAASAGYGNQDQMEADSAASELMAWR